MNNKIKFYTSDFEGNSPIDSSLFDYQLEKLEFRLPKEYIDFMRQMNGGEGAIGENGYLMLLAN